MVGYRIEIVFLNIASADLALRRIAARVRQGGHDVPEADVRRRLDRCLANFESRYKLLADRWELYDASQSPPVLIERGP